MRRWGYCTQPVIVQTFDGNATQESCCSLVKNITWQKQFSYLPPRSSYTSFAWCLFELHLTPDYWPRRAWIWGWVAIASTVTISWKPFHRITHKASSEGVFSALLGPDAWQPRTHHSMYVCWYVVTVFWAHKRWGHWGHKRWGGLKWMLRCENYS